MSDEQLLFQAALVLDEAAAHLKAICQQRQTPPDRAATVQLIRSVRDWSHLAEAMPVVRPPV